MTDAQRDSRFAPPASPKPPSRKLRLFPGPVFWPSRIDHDTPRARIQHSRRHAPFIRAVTGTLGQSRAIGTKSAECQLVLHIRLASRPGATALQSLVDLKPGGRVRAVRPVEIRQPRHIIQQDRFRRRVANEIRVRQNDVGVAEIPGKSLREKVSGARWPEMRLLDPPQSPPGTGIAGFKAIAAVCVCGFGEIGPAEMDLAGNDRIPSVCPAASAARTIRSA